MSCTASGGNGRDDDDSGVPTDDSGRPPPDDSGKDSDGEDSGTDTGSEACTDDAILSLLTTHLADLAASGAFLVGHASETEAVGLFVLPGWVGVSAQYASLFMPCTKPLTYDPWCEKELCWQLECTGEGAGIVTHGWIEVPPIVSGDVEITTGTVDTEWIEETDEVVYHLVSTSTGPGGVDLSVDGTGTLTPDGTTALVESYPGLGVVLEATLHDGSVDATITMSDVIVAATDDGGHLVATGECP